jgi:hypothetical protein
MSAVNLPENATVQLASGAITSANPLHTFLQGSTATVTIQGNATISGNVTAIQTTASIIRVEVGSSGFPVSGNVSAVVNGNVTAVLSTAGMGGSSASPIIGAQQFMLGQVFYGGSILTASNASINVTASGIVSLVASATGAIAVLQAHFSAGSSCAIQWAEGATGAASGLTGVESLAANGGFALPYTGLPWFKTTTGKPLLLSVQGSTGGVGGAFQSVTVVS